MATQRRSILLIPLIVLVGLISARPPASFSHVSAWAAGIRAGSTPMGTPKLLVLRRFVPMVITCPSGEVCYLLSGRGPGLLSQRAVFSTVDGAKTWVIHHPRLPAVGVLQRLACPTVSVCFGMGDNAVTRTTDGGGNWRPVLTTKPRLGGITCPTALVCYVMAGPGQANYSFWRTTDGGQTWKRGRSGGANLGSAIACPTTTTCFTNSGAITTDGTQTWKKTSAAAGWATMSCPTSEICFGAIDLSPRDAPPNPNAPTNDILFTTDGGRTWNRTRALGNGTRYYLISISCPSAMECYAGGILGRGGGIIVATQDGGKTWHPESIQSVKRVRVPVVSSVSCGAPGVCRAIGGPFLLTRH